MKINMGTRASALALAQSTQVKDELERLNPGLQINLIKITTQADRIQDRFLNEIGGKGLFIKEIEEALLSQEIDFAVHSMKDLPANLEESFVIAAVPKRESYADALLTMGSSLLNLKEGARIGTCSDRRRVQLRKIRPDFSFEFLRGNIDTRMKKLAEGEFDAIVLARSGMNRLGLIAPYSEDLEIIPAPGQGALALEARAGDVTIHNILKSIHHEETHTLSHAERVLMQNLGGDCNLPFGAHCTLKGESCQLEGFVASPDGERYLHEKDSAPLKELDQILIRMTSSFKNRGSDQILKEL